MHQPDERAACLQFVHALDARCAERVERFRHGAALLCPSVPRVYSLNFLLLDPGASPSVEELLEDADRLLARFAHRRVVTDDDAVGTRLAEELAARDWKLQPLRVMPWRGPEGRTDPSTVREVTFEDLEPCWRAGTREAGFDEDVVDQIVGQRRIIGRAGRARYFAAFVEAEIASYCELYSDGEIAQIEGVLTFERYRGRGLAKAVVSYAREAAERSRHRVTFLLAEEHDWPREFYRKLGFQDAGRIWDFLLESRDPSPVTLRPPPRS
jgi:ribosomal protein S18 acetylase RimI-like enzyme